MISKIKVEIAFLKKSFLRLPYYEVKDVTKSVVLPIIDIETLDETLDITDLTICNKRQDPYLPFTKFIITLYEDENNFRIYRYLDTDNVEQKTFGQNCIYSHKIRLLEPTKILEREPVQNLSFTNYLSANNNTAGYSVTSCTLQGFRTKLVSSTYANSTRYLKRIKHGESISGLSKLNVQCSTVGYIPGVPSIPIKTLYFNLSLDESKLVKPDGSRITISLDDEILFNQLGKYKIEQTYSGSKNDNYIFYKYDGSATVKYTWEINVVSSIEDEDQPYTITEVLNRLLSCYQCRQEGVQEQKYFLDPIMAERFADIPAPEFNFTNATLFEALSQIGGYVHAIPRLIPTITEDEEDQEDYWYNWNIITFDLLDEGEKYENDIYSLSESSANSENFTRGLVSEVQNGLQSAYNKNSTMIEPYQGGFISTRTESGDFEVNNDTFCLKTTLPIGYVKKLSIFYGEYGSTPTEIIDITSCVVEKAIYDTFAVYDGSAGSSDSFESRFGYLYFERGRPNIKGCDYQKTSSNFIQEFFDSFNSNNSLEFAIKKVKGDLGTTKYSSRNARSLCYQVEYIPYLAFLTKQNKDYIDPSLPEIYTYYNQNANVVDIDSLGEHTRGVLAKLSNADYSETQYLKKYAKKPKVGQRSNDNYRCYSTATEIWIGAPLKVTTKWSKNYNKLNENISYKKAIREYEVSENESFERYIDCGEFLIISDKLDVEAYYDVNELLERKTGENYEEIQDAIEEELCQVQVCNEKIVNVISNRISGIEKYPVVRPDPQPGEVPDLYPYGEFATSVSYAFVQTLNDGDEAPIQTFILPVASFTFGNSVILLAKTQDNYSAQSTAKTKPDNTVLEDYIDYGDEYGRADLMKVAYGFFSPYSDYKNDLVSRGKKLYKFDGELNEDDVVIDLRDYPFMVQKDSRESISITTRLSVCTDNPSVKFGKNVTNIVPFITKDFGRFKFVLFKTGPRMFDSQIQNDDYFEIPNWSKWMNTDIRTIQIFPVNEIKGDYTSPIDCVGYGMLDTQNNLICFIEKEIKIGDIVPDIFLMFRKNV